MSHSVCVMQWRDVFSDGGGGDPCNLSGVQLARQLMKLNSFICLTYHLSDNLKLRHKFSSTTYTNQEFWFHLCYMHSSCRYSPLNKIRCFVLVSSNLGFLERILLQRILLVTHEKLIGSRWNLEGVYTRNFIPGWNLSRDEIIPVYSEMFLTVYTLLPRWNFIPGWTHPCQKDRDEISSRDEKKKKRRVNTSSRDEILKWACFF